MAGDRLRFAPSPTGSLHVGNARTALINWLSARRSGGAFIVRVEDTDVERSERANEETILEDLRWLGLGWDEGPDIGGPHAPYRQSERGDFYRAAVDQLVASGLAYPDLTSADVVADLRSEAIRRGESFRYRGEHREISVDEARTMIDEGGAAVRFKVADHDVRFVDELRGETGLAAAEISDFIVARADGMPTYNLAVVVDDHEMHVDRVIRGADHLTNTSRQALLYEALGWSAPRFAHLPLVLGTDRSRLSKRHGATSVAEMRAGGILPEALCNFLALLGWSPPGEQEVLSMAELEKLYEVGDLAAANSVFDETKLEWLNGQHMAQLPAAELFDRAEPFLAAAGVPTAASDAARGWWTDVVALVGIGARRLTELAGPAHQLAHPDVVALHAAAEEVRAEPTALAAVRAFADASRAGELDDEDGYNEVVVRVRDATGAKGRGLFHPLRLAISGEDSGPELKRFVPLLEKGAALELETPVAGVAARIEIAIAPSPPPLAGSG